MDRNKNAWKMEAIKNMLCIYWIVTKGDWFGSNQLSTLIAPIALSYFVASSVAVYYLSKNNNDSKIEEATKTAILFIQEKPSNNNRVKKMNPEEIPYKPFINQ
jgi:hypothetical protein